jgi:hypothetical protein
MKLTIPALPPILAGADVQAWRKWFAFWSLPLEYKADIVDRFPSLVIVKGSSPEAISMGMAERRVFFDPVILDTQIPEDVIYKAWDSIKDSADYPMQPYSKLQFGTPVKEMLFAGLTTMNFSVLAYKYRYLVRPENFYFGMDYELELSGATTEAELSTFYASPRKN